MTVSAPTVAPEAHASGAAPAAEPPMPSSLTLSLLSRSPDVRKQLLARAASPDFEDWLAHVRPAADCTRPIRLYGVIDTIERDSLRLLSSVDTPTLPDGVIYKRCGNRRAAACPSCSKLYQRDAYQIFYTLLVGGRGVPESVAQHPAVFPTFTAPSFGPVHTRIVDKHTCGKRSRCDCRPRLCHPDRMHPRCVHGRPMECYARHDDVDKALGTPLCAACYDYPAQVVWNLEVGELWRRTLIAIERFVHRRARARGIDPDTIKVTCAKAGEFQRRAAIHLHAIMRLDRIDPEHPTELLPPTGLDATDLADAVAHAARVTAFTTRPHPARPGGWRIAWGDQVHTKVICSGAGPGQITPQRAAQYLAKYATKSTEVTGHVSGRLTAETLAGCAHPFGTHAQRLIATCWLLGRHKQWRRLRMWAHQLGFGSHFLTKSRRHRVTFTLLRNHRVIFRRSVPAAPAPKPAESPAPERETTLVVNFLQFVGAGWHNTGDALLANTSAALAREHQRVARTAIAEMTE